jgi:hypothetical protein
MAAAQPLRDTARRFTFEIAAITAGILIALSIDAFVERQRERALVSQARAGISREIADNRQDLERGSKSLEKHMDDLIQALRFADEMLRARKSDVHELNIGVSFPSLNRAAWQTAERTGALGYMDYDEVKEFSELYELQDLVADSQRQLLVRLSGLTAVIAGAGGDPTKASAQDLQVFRSRLLDSIGALTIHRSLAGQLADGYKKREPTSAAP